MLQFLNFILHLGLEISFLTYFESLSSRNLIIYEHLLYNIKDNKNIYNKLIYITIISIASLFWFDNNIVTLIMKIDLRNKE